MIHHHNAACSFLLFSLHGDDIQREDKSGNYVKGNVNHSHNRRGALPSWDSPWLFVAWEAGTQ